jgi:hypothetical protein
MPSHFDRFARQLVHATEARMRAFFATVCVALGGSMAASVRDFQGYSNNYARDSIR